MLLAFLASRFRYVVVLSAIVTPCVSAAGPFLPPTENLAFHLQANRGVAVHSAGVTDWFDQTAAGVDFTVDTSATGREPTLSLNQLNGLPALSFAGDKLLNNDFKFGVDQTVFIVLAGDNVTSDLQRYMGHYGDGQLRYKNGYLHGWFGGGTLPPEDLNIAVTKEEFALATYQFNSDNVLVAVNGNPFVTLKGSAELLDRYRAGDRAQSEIRGPVLTAALPRCWYTTSRLTQRNAQPLKPTWRTSI